jgi:hypothetical protein
VSCISVVPYQISMFRLVFSSKGDRTVHDNQKSFEHWPQEAYEALLTEGDRTSNGVFVFLHNKT